MTGEQIFGLLGLLALAIPVRWAVRDFREGVFCVRINFGRVVGEFDRIDEPAIFWGLHLFNLSIIATLAVVFAKLVVGV